MKKKDESQGKSASQSEVDPDLATVQRANQARLEDLARGAQALREDTKSLLAEVDAVVDPDLLETILGEDRLRLITEQALPRSDEISSWNEAVDRSRSELQARDIETPNSIVELLSPEENERVSAYLGRPIYERIPWDRWDLFVAFGAGIAGAAVDVLLGTPGRFVQQAMADKNHWLGSWMESIHERDPGGAIIDYQGPHFGGPYHRGLTTGHDLLRPLEGIRQFKDGIFQGFYYKDGVKHLVETASNQYGNPYGTMGWGAAVLAWMVHNACDFFSSKSLPIPGTSWLYEQPDRDVRIFVQNDLYQNGINLRHVTLQALAPLVVEVGIRTYTAIRYRNAEAPGEALRQKRTELLVLGHMLTTAVNLGKIVVLKDPTMLNVPALLALLRHVLGLVVLEQGRNSFVAKISRNAAELRASQEEIEGLLNARFPVPILLS
jgi:hypothetical protein